MSWRETSHLFLLFLTTNAKVKQQKQTPLLLLQVRRTCDYVGYKNFLSRSCNVFTALGLHQSHLTHEICAEPHSQEPSRSHFISFRLLEAKSLE